ncbi:hypothetical protein [Streptomyces malaysiensis]|uniref:Uncharacterized protein n=1 Tax=Streptomyces malaysiensis subsp. samsunensis TaxID=459658 RepID=A0A9X2LTD1_STRMQ|nr:hypothetical protein [Streptomyces samsunensis]MCQ8829382.1 hypothetical protein [Streptomyces samsunensis]
MTQSGQGNEPRLPAVPPAQPVREGVVLPAQGDYKPSDTHQAAPAGGQAWGQPWGPQSAPEPPPQGEFGAPLPPEGQPYGQQPEGQPYGQQQPDGQPYGQHQAEIQPYGQQPPEGQYGQRRAEIQPYGQLPEAQPDGQQQPEGQPYGQQGWPAAPERPAQPPYQAADETQVMPPQPAGDADATQVIPPVPGEAPPPLDTPTTTLAAVKSAPLPPENRPESPAESTTQLRAVRPGRRGAHRQQPPAAAADETAVLPPTPAAMSAPGSAPQVPERPGGAPYAIRPGRPGDRPPPSEFDGLFRDSGGADETQQLPQFGPDVPQPPSPPSGGHGGGGGGRRRMSRGMLIGVVVAGCALAGLAAGAVLSMGGDDDNKKNDTTLSDSSPSAEQSSEPADPAEPQAKALDALLADSNNSRASVIKAVDNIKSCKDLTTAASDLRTAAGQRNDLVTRLGKLSVDKLPDNARLTASLTKAWKSSARADNEYAAWADQTGGKRGCHKGKARRTPRVGAAERASGEATQAKKTASGLWNPIASRYGLTTHEATEL